MNWTFGTHVDGARRRPGVVGAQNTGDVLVTELGAGLTRAEELELRLRARADGVARCRRRCRCSGSRRARGRGTGLALRVVCT